MSVIGTYDPWARTFRDDLMPQIIELVLSVWQSLRKPGRDEFEPRVTRLLRHGLLHEKQRRHLPFRIGREEVVDDPSTGEEKGRIDIVFMHGWEDDVYFAFECKRLNVRANGGVKALATEYVEQGMLRFVTGKYAAGLDKGGMIGFVMDGNSATAMVKVDAEIRNRHRLLLMSTGSGLSASSLLPSPPTIRETRHPRRSPALTLHHVFLEV